MVTAFLGAKTYGAGRCARQSRRASPSSCARFHDEMPKHVSGAGFMFWVFHVIRDYARTLEAGDSRMAHALPGYLALADELERGAGSRCRSSSATTICCRPISSTTASGSG